MLSQPKREGGMGFCAIRDFNVAMLAKQGWRLLQDHGSLLYGCFKDRYFPRSTFLEASDVPNSSYVWKSLIAAQPILKKKKMLLDGRRWIFYLIYSRSMDYTSPNK